MAELCINKLSAPMSSGRELSAPHSSSHKIPLQLWQNSNEDSIVSVLGFWEGRGEEVRRFRFRFRFRFGS
jgi:hypothetical protein